MIWQAIRKLPAALICVVCVVSWLSCTSTEEPGVVEVAYELRMNGKLNEAKKNLEDALAKNPEYAAGHYEFSRLKLHEALGSNPRDQLPRLLSEAQKSIDQAVELDPESVIYPFFAGQIGFMLSYLAMNMGESDVQERIARTCDAFVSVLQLKPDYHEAKLNLVELYGLLPAEMGGDKSKAETYLSELAKSDEVYGMKARSILDEVSVADWGALHEKYPGRTDVLEELGKAHLREGNVSEAGKCFDEVVEIDPSELTLFLDLGRFHFIHVMELFMSEEKEELPIHLAAAEAAVLRYLEAEHPAPMKAYALRMLSKVKHAAGDKEARDRLVEEAKELDPYHSRVTGNPSIALFTPPGTLARGHRYLTRPF